MILSRFTKCTLILWCSALLTTLPSIAIGLNEASGVARQGNDLLFVSDEDPGAIYRHPVPVPEPGSQKIQAFELDVNKIERTLLSNGSLALDLESLDILGNREVVLSERLAALIDKEGIIVELDHSLSELGNRGLEGLAIHKMQEEDKWSVAVLWEGGFPESAKLPDQLVSNLTNVNFSPVIWVFDLTGQDLTTRPIQMVKDPKVGKNQRKPRNVVTLNIPCQNENANNPQCFRAPDLVWHSWKQGDVSTTGFIVLLSSENSDSNNPNKTFQHKWLQRFDTNGTPIGDPIKLEEVLKKLPKPHDELHKANWEGLAWFEEGKSLVLIHDKPPGGIPKGIVFQLPPDFVTDTP